MIMRKHLSISSLAMLPLASFSFSGVNVVPSSNRRDAVAFRTTTTMTTTTTTTTRATTTTALFGLFDGVKDAFSAPTLERSQIDAERETPIDRWMGWSVASENKKGQQQSKAIDAASFVDAMDAKNYVTVHLAKPMGIVFEENDADFGGIFVHSLKADGVAARDGTVQVGDQLVAVHSTKVSGLPFDDALSAIIDATEPQVQLLFFRGKADQFYGPTGASQEWLDEFVGTTTPTNVSPPARALEVVDVTRSTPTSSSSSS